MTLYQFNSLDEMEQAEAVWDGVFIGDREVSQFFSLPVEIALNNIIEGVISNKNFIKIVLIIKEI